MISHVDRALAEPSDRMSRTWRGTACQSPSLAGLKETPGGLPSPSPLLTDLRDLVAHQASVPPRPAASTRRGPTRGAEVSG